MDNTVASSLKTLVFSFIRTVVPYIVSFFISMLLAAGIAVPEDLKIALGGFLTLAFGALYYLLVRLVEQYVAPKFGWLLGVAKQVQYEGAPVEQDDSLESTDTPEISDEH